MLDGKKKKKDCKIVAEWVWERKLVWGQVEETIYFFNNYVLNTCEVPLLLLHAVCTEKINHSLLLRESQPSGGDKMKGNKL